LIRSTQKPLSALWKCHTFDSARKHLAIGLS
jgi:hypothetical protein